MKTTIDIPEIIYRKVKAKSAIEGRPVRNVAIELFSAWLDQSDTPENMNEKPIQTVDTTLPTWFASLHKYAQNAGGQYDMAAIRRSISRGRAREESI